MTFVSHTFGMDKARVTAKDFFLWAGAMVALYWSVISFILLIFNYIDYTFPTPTSFAPIDPYEAGVGHEMASIIVLFPIYLILVWLIRRDMKRDHSRKNIWVRRWALIFTLFITGLTIAIDLITVLTTFFDGESFTESFVMKAALVLLVAAAVFMHFSADLRGYWEEYPMRKQSVAIGVSALAILTIFAGFLIIGTPWQAQAYQFDEQKVNDLQTIQSEIVTYWQEESKLPATLAALNDPTAGVTVPVDEQSGKPYEYDVVGKLGFKLCAFFNASTASYAITAQELALPVASGGPESQDLSGSWYHDAGQQCFTRAIDPSRYPKAPTQ